MIRTALGSAGALDGVGDGAGDGVDDAPSRPGAVVLAGGLARRMGGRDKGLLPLHDRALVSYVLEAIRPAVRCSVINANRHADRYAAFGVPVVADAHADYPGPLAGLAAGIDALDTDTVFMCPCDSPFVSAALVEALVRGLADAGPRVPIACAHDGERLQPVFALVRRECRASLEDWLTSGKRKIDAWYAEAGFVAVDCHAQAGAFVNINTEQERLAAERALAHG